jgi:hypothetical protein
VRAIAPCRGSERDERAQRLEALALPRTDPGPFVSRKPLCRRTRRTNEDAPRGAWARTRGVFSDRRSIEPGRRSPDSFVQRPRLLERPPRLRDELELLREREERERERDEREPLPRECERPEFSIRSWSEVGAICSTPCKRRAAREVAEGS